MCKTIIDSNKKDGIMYTYDYPKYYSTVFDVTVESAAPSTAVLVGIRVEATLSIKKLDQAGSDPQHPHLYSVSNTTGNTGVFMSLVNVLKAFDTTVTRFPFTDVDGSGTRIGGGIITYEDGVLVVAYESGQDGFYRAE
jgi:hypothetical protein